MGLLMLTLEAVFAQVPMSGQQGGRAGRAVASSEPPGAERECVEERTRSASSAVTSLPDLSDHQWRPLV